MNNTLKFNEWLEAQNKNIQGNGILYLSLEDITDKLVFNENLINEILGL